MQRKEEALSAPLMEGEVLLQPLSSWTSWHIGGQAERFYSPPDITHLVQYLQILPPGPITWLGLGSNVLIRDGGISGAVICTRGLQSLAVADGNIVVDAGVTCAKFARFASQKGFSDSVFFAGIPGTIGGALAMNAGAFGGETWEWVQEVMVINRQGTILRRPLSDYAIGYRSVCGTNPEQKEEAFIGATFRFPYRGNSDGMQKIRALLKKRAQSQPIGTLNCGSVYRNPPGDFAARLIEECQLKGYQIGDAMISPKHANFIINGGKASAKDVETLMSTIETTVWERFGVHLQAEVRILGRISSS